MRKSSSTLRSISLPVYSSPTISSTIPPPIRQEAKKLQVWNYFKCGDKGHIANQCPTYQVNMALHGDVISYEEHIDKEIKIEAKDAKAKLIEVIVESDCLG